jgi:hypothetical protein
MIAGNMLRIVLLSCLLGGCSTALLEDVGDVTELTPPRPCSEATKIFNTFSMRATRVSWKGDKADTSATLTLELAFNNDKNYPIALSNSGNGVLYTVQVTLQGGKGTTFAPKEAGGVLLMREPKQFKEPRRGSVFGQPAQTKKPAAPVDATRDLNFRIKPGEPEAGKLVFQLPRENYLLSIERKFADKPMSAQPADYIAFCKISSSDTASLDR